LTLSESKKLRRRAILNLTPAGLNFISAITQLGVVHHLSPPSDTDLVVPAMVFGLRRRADGPKNGADERRPLVAERKETPLPRLQVFILCCMFNFVFWRGTRLAAT
jgi:hypothetical protein